MRQITCLSHTGQAGVLGGLPLLLLSHPFLDGLSHRRILRATQELTNQPLLNDHIQIDASTHPTNDQLAGIPALRRNEIDIFRRRIGQAGVLFRRLRMTIRNSASVSS